LSEGSYELRAALDRRVGFLHLAVELKLVAVRNLEPDRLVLTGFDAIVDPSHVYPPVGEPVCERRHVFGGFGLPTDMIDPRALGLGQAERVVVVLVDGSEVDAVVVSVDDFQSNRSVEKFDRRFEIRYLKRYVA